jgi:hypothetical protein
MGAETLVGQLNMESPDTGNSGPPTPNDEKPTTPKPPETRNTSPLDGALGSNENGVSSCTESTPKANQFSRRIELPPPASHSSGSSHNPAGQRGSLGNSRQSANSNAGISEGAPNVDSGDGQGPNYQQAQANSEGQQSGPLMETNFPVTENNSSFTVGGDEPATTGQAFPSFTSSTGKDSESSETRPTLGKLTSLPGSIINTTLPLESRMTSWGRGPKATIRHPDAMDIRIPQYALELTFWAPSIEARIEAGEDWMEIPNVMTILSTKTSKCIWVNDIALHKESPDKDGYSLFGKLYTGDIITIYRSRDQFLKFRCEFYHGESSGKRPEGEKGFVIEKSDKIKDHRSSGEETKA